MKQKILWSICAMFLCFGTGCPAASFDDLWKQVEKYERQDLPKSAYKVVGQIAAKADKERQKVSRWQLCSTVASSVRTSYPTVLFRHHEIGTTQTADCQTRFNGRCWPPCWENCMKTMPTVTGITATGRTLIPTASVSGRGNSS